MTVVCVAAVSTEDLPEEVEDEETVTEVEVSEKALKFKISTEGSIGSGRKSYPGSRKGSRDKTLTQDCHMHELVRAMRDKDREYRRADSTREYSRVSSTSPVSSQGEAECLLEALHEDIATNQKAVHNGGADNIMLDNTCACKTCKMVGHGSLKKHEQAKHIKVSDDNDLREQVNETVSCCLDSCRGYGECRSGSIYDQSENATGTQCTARSAQEAILKSDCIITDVGKSGASQHHKSSILSRIRNFADKISFSSSSDKDGDGKTKHNHLLKSPSISAQSSPTTPKHDRRVLKIQSAVRDESPSTSSLTTIPQSDDGSKAMTLPKVKRSQRQNGNHRSWKLFLAGSKSGIPASSPELLSDTQFYQSPPNGKKHIFRNKTNASESSTPPHKSMQHTAEESGETSGGGKQEPAAKEESLVSGSLDSVLPGKRSSNHRNYKSSSGSKHAVLLARMGRSESDDSGCTSPRGHTWMSSLRQKKTKDQEHCRSAHALQD
ncbi:hypothetical protein PR048_027042 [Dryococelus australis]|uniref:Uncharacterized protein n=1 Tax=Dryococelus australis TaxID=614101 RepID=A0ABQ9GEA7_9NEOP|nr:hypothetical protein PR048_027042 [Dryococelus australis]